MRSIGALTIVALAASCGLQQPSASPASAPSATPAAALASVPLDTLASHIVALGDGWRLDSDPQAGLTLDRPRAGDAVSVDYTAPTRTETGASRIASAPLVVTFSNAACTQDGVSYPMRAEVSVAGAAPLTGCAYARWDTKLVEMLPAIDACLAAQAEGASVLHAAPDPGGRILVRIATGASRIDCRAPRDPAAGPIITAPADPMLKLPGEGDPAFVRAPGAPPGGECYQAPEVRGPDGALIGWLAETGPC